MDVTVSPIVAFIVCRSEAAACTSTIVLWEPTTSREVCRSLGADAYGFAFNLIHFKAGLGAREVIGGRWHVHEHILTFLVGNGRTFGADGRVGQR